MKPLILPIAAFVLFFALGGGAGVYVMRPAAADSTAVDSTHADSTGAAHPDSAVNDSTAHFVPNNAETAPEGSPSTWDAHAADAAPPSASGVTLPANSVGPHSTTPAGTTPAGTMPAGTTPAGTTPAGTTPGTATPGASTSGGSARPAPPTIQSLLRAQNGTTVNLRPNGSIGGPLADSLPDYARMARLLSKMGPREAARTVERLGGTEAARALAAMTDKQAALVLQQLTPEKAAALLVATLALVPKLPVP